MNTDSVRYEGYVIEHNLYGQGEYTVFADGEDVWFDTVEGAEAFIDEITDRYKNQI